MFAGTQVVAVRVGVGTARSAEVTRAAIRAIEPDHVIVVGVAGGLSSAQHPGELVVPEVVVDLDRGTEHRPAPFAGRVVEGRLLTSARLHGWGRLSAWAESAVAVDMETAAVAAECESAGVGWSVYRGLSDLVPEAIVQEATLSLVREDGSTDLPAVLALLVHRPRAVIELARLGRDTAAAMTAVVDALAADLSAAPGCLPLSGSDAVGPPCR